MIANIKAIETHYNGYRFRSRLEARWAVFFDILGVRWEYETEGYELSDGTRYLPDFWLPTIRGRNLDKDGVFVEIKPVEPSGTEDRKAMLLCAGTGKCVYIFAGLPFTSHWNSQYYYYNEGEGCDNLGTVFSSAGDPLTNDDLETRYLEYLYERDEFPPLIPSISGLDETVAMDFDDWKRYQGYSFVGGLYYDIGWDNCQSFMACPHCHGLNIEYNIEFDRTCECRTGDQDIVRLNAACKAARSARFEHGEHGR